LLGKRFDLNGKQEVSTKGGSLRRKGGNAHAARAAATSDKKNTSHTFPTEEGEKSSRSRSTEIQKTGSEHGEVTGREN